MSLGLGGSGRLDAGPASELPQRLTQEVLVVLTLLVFLLVFRNDLGRTGLEQFLVDFLYFETQVVFVLEVVFVQGVFRRIVGFLHLGSLLLLPVIEFRVPLSHIRLVLLRSEQFAQLLLGVVLGLGVELLLGDSLDRAPFHPPLSLHEFLSLMIDSLAFAH